MTDDEKAELAGVYERAAEYLEEYGWIRGSIGTNLGPRCMAGAIQSVLGYDEDTYAKVDNARLFICKALELHMPHPANVVYPIGVWNDDPIRTADEVINTLHALANKLR